MRAVSVLEVARVELWAELEAAMPDGAEPLAEYTERALGERRRVMKPSFERWLPVLRSHGAPVLVRYAAPEWWTLTQPVDLSGTLRDLPADARMVLYRAQRLAANGIVVGAHAWDPECDAASVSTLFGAGLMVALHEGGEHRHGRYRLHADLPDPPERPYDFDDATMPETDDLAPAGPGPIAVLHDLGALSAALVLIPQRRTLGGALDRVAARKLGKRLRSDGLASTGALEHDLRWKRALAALEAMQAVRMDLSSRVLHVEPGLESALEGTTAEALRRLVCRMIDPALHPVLPALRAALRAADGRAVDEMIWRELLAEQHRDVLFSPWLRDGQKIYPSGEGEGRAPWTNDTFDVIEGRMLEETLTVAVRLGLVRRAPGVFAATPDGRVWATGDDRPAPPVWVGSDLDLIVPPDSITPWERYQLERLGRCSSREVVDRYRLEREGVEAWLGTHELADALAILERRCPGLPESVRQTLAQWETSAFRFVLTRGVLVEG